MMSKPVVSVIIPFHNRFEWTLEALQSVLIQTFQDFEIILVDDASRKPAQIQWTEIDSRIRYQRLEENGGPSAARNVGISQSQGAFIAFLDSDDLFLPEKLEIQVEVMRSNPALMLSYTGAIMMNEIGDEFGLFPIEQNKNVYPFIWENCSILTPCVMLRKEVLKSFRFPENINTGEDLILWAKIARQFSPFYIAKPLTKVRFLGTSTSIDPEKFISHISHVISDGVMKDDNLSHFIYHRILSNLNILMASQYLRLHDMKSALKHITIAFLHYPYNVRFLRLLVKYSFLSKFIKVDQPTGITLPGEAPNRNDQGKSVQVAEK